MEQNSIKEVLETNTKEEFRNSINVLLDELTELDNCTSFKELKKNIKSLQIHFEYKSRDLELLWIIEDNNESKKFKCLSPYTIKISFFYSCCWTINLLHLY